MRKAAWLPVFLMVLLVPEPGRAAHPLITDDAYTQGKGKSQLEVTGQYDSDRETVDGVAVKTTGRQVAATLTYGIVDTVDLAVGAPFLWIREQDDGAVVSNVKGISDTILDVKWRIFEHEGLSFALKPGIGIPTGDDGNGLGTGRIGYHLFAIVTKEAEPWAMHANLGYIRNENRFEELTNLWHVSAAATYAAGKNLKIAGDIGAERNPDRSSQTEPAYVLAGVIYSVTEYFDLDCGVKHAITSTEKDVSIMAGMTFRF